MQVMAHHTHEPDPETPEKAKRRNFTDAQKLKILELLDKTEEGKKGALMRSMGVYSSSVTTWKRLRDAGRLTPLAPRKRGRKPTKDPVDKEKEQLRRRVAQLERKLETAELIITVQKKVSQLLGITLPTADEPSEKS